MKKYEIEINPDFTPISYPIFEKRLKQLCNEFDKRLKISELNKKNIWIEQSDEIPMMESVKGEKL